MKCILLHILRVYGVVQDTKPDGEPSGTKGAFAFMRSVGFYDYLKNLRRPRSMSARRLTVFSLYICVICTDEWPSMR